MVINTINRRIFQTKKVASLLTSSRFLSISNQNLFIYKDKNVTIEAPVYKKGGNRLANAIKYVNEVDATRKLIDKIPDQAKATVLLERIEGNPELLFYVAMFHHQLAKIGITQNNEDRTSLLWKYRWSYVTLLKKVHGIFFDLCQVLGVTENKHKLGFTPDKIGILDPNNFTSEQYQELQTGKYKGTDYSEILMIGDNPFKNKKKNRV